LGVDDPRINVLWACVDRVVVLAKRRVLVLAVLEEVKELFSLRYCKDGWDEYGARTSARRCSDASVKDAMGTPVTSRP
jgi:hypothetical protein